MRFPIILLGLAFAAGAQKIPDSVSVSRDIVEVNDVKAAVRWMRAEAKRYGIRPDAIGAIVGSAGGHLVAMLGTSHKIADLEGDGGHAGVSSRVQAVVAMAPVVDFSGFKGRDPKTRFDFLGSSFEENPAVWAKASPVTH